MTTSLNASSSRTSAASRCEDLDDAVGVFAGADADRQRGDGEVAREVGDGGDLAVGHDVERAVAVAQLGHAQGQVLDRALQARRS